MIHPLETIAAIENLYTTASITVSSEMATNEDAVRHAKTKLVRSIAKGLIEAAHPWAFDIHEDDIDLQLSEFYEARWGVHRFDGTVKWRPKTLEVQLHGGPADGHIYTVQSPLQPIQVAIRDDATYFDDAAKYVEVADKRITYQLSGWDDINRRWAYEPTERA